MISVFFPTYNEKDNIRPTVQKAFDFLLKINMPFEVIVVNDGSTDGTAEVLQELKTDYTNLIIVNHQQNSGYGAALRSGFKEARGDLIFFMDSDGQFDISDIKIFLERINKHDFIIGYRKKRADTFVRILHGKLLRILCHVFFGVKVRDVDCAFKLFHAKVIKSLDLRSPGATISIEILAQAQRKGFSNFIELPVKHFPRKFGEQTGGSFKVISKAAYHFFSLWLKMMNRR